MSALGNPLLICQAPPATALPQLAQAVGATTVVCEDIAAPYEQSEVAALRAAGLQVQQEGAGVLTSLTETDGLVELSENTTTVEPGSTVGFLPYASLIG